MRILLLLLLLVSSVCRATITLDLTASYSTSGKAPLTVTFVSTGTTATSETKPIHHLTYCYDAGDGSSAVYSSVQTFLSGGHKTTPRRQFCGAPRFTYVYETPGTYTAQLWAFSATESATTTVQITVNDYTDAETECIDADSTFDANGDSRCTGASVTKTTSATSWATALNDCKGAGRKRCLFDARDSFTAGAVTLNVDGMHIGSYGGGRTTLINGPTSGVYIQISADDVRVGEFNWTGGSGVELVNYDSNVEYNLFTDMTVDTVDSLSTISSVLFANSGDNWERYNTYRSIHVGTCGNYCIFLGSGQVSFMDNILEESNGEHTIRFSHVRELFFHNNYVGRELPSGKSVFTLRGCDFGGVGNGNCPGEWAELNFISDNFFNPNNWVHFGGSNGPTEYSNFRNTIWERNHFQCAPGTAHDPANLFFTGSSASGPGNTDEDATIRYNTAYTEDCKTGTDATKWFTFSQMTRLEMHHNSMYGYTRFVETLSGCSYVGYNVAWNSTGDVDFAQSSCDAFEQNHARDAVGSGTNVDLGATNPYTGTPAADTLAWVLPNASSVLIDVTNPSSFWQGRCDSVYGLVPDDTDVDAGAEERGAGSCLMAVSAGGGPSGAEPSGIFILLGDAQL